MALRQRTNAYWAKRANERLVESEKTSDKYRRQIRKLYTQTQRDTLNQLKKIYADYWTKDGGFDKQKLHLMVSSKDMNSFVAKLKKAGLYDKIPENYLGRINRLEYLNAQMWYESHLAGMKQDGILTEANRQVYEDSYYRSVYDVSRGIGSTPSFTMLDKQTIDRVLETKFDGKNYSERIWGNSDILANQLKDKLAQAIATGQSIQKTSRDFRERFNVQNYYAERLVRTETNYFHNSAELESYDSMGFEYYEFLATLDSRTSEICQHMDGKKIKVSEAKQGENAPPLHPNCRSTIVPYFKDFEPETRLYRDPETNRNEYVYNMNYEEWRKKFLVNSDAGAKQVSSMMGKIHPIIGDGVMGDLGIKRGHPISHEKAIKGANPKYKKGTNYERNCQRCVPVYELRRRGYDVTAAPKPLYNFMGRSDIAFVDKKTGNFPKFSPLRTSRKMMEKDMAPYPNNSRFAVRIGQGKGKPGHVFVAEKIDGKICYSDPQTGKINALSNFSPAKNMQFFRMDNLQINNNKLLMRSIIERDD